MVHCIVGNRLPFRLIENVQFRRLLNLAAGPNTRLHFPNRNGVKDLLMQLAHTSQQNTMDTLPSDSKISIALDCWTSPDQKPFMAVIGISSQQISSFLRLSLVSPHWRGHIRGTVLDQYS